MQSEQLSHLYHKKHWGWFISPTIMSYSITFWGNSSNSKNIFRLQIKVIRIMINSRTKYSCRELFKKLRILQFYSQFTFSLITFVINSCDFLNQILYCTILIPDIKIIFTFICKSLNVSKRCLLFSHQDF